MGFVRNAVGMIYPQPFGRIIRWTALLVLLWALLGRCMKGRRIWKGLNVCVFIGTFGVILTMTLRGRSVGVYEVILWPLHSFIEAKTQPEIYRAMLMNVFLFVPLGLSMPNILPHSRKPGANIRFTILFGICLSIAIEWCQYRYGIGRCETDDVLTNALGTAIGCLSAGLQSLGTSRQSAP